MTIRIQTLSNMTFRPAARCATDAGGNLRRLIGSAPAGGFSISIAGRFLRRFRSRFEGRRFRRVLPGTFPGTLPGALPGAFPGGAERKRDVSGLCSADCAPPGGDDRSCMVRPPCLSGARGKMPRHVIVITPPRHRPCDLSSSSGASSEGDSVLGSVFNGSGSALEDAIRFSEMGDCGQRRKKRNLASRKTVRFPKSAQNARPGDISKKGG